MEEFIKNFAKQFDETDESELNENTEFHELTEWSSLIGLAVLNMIAKKYSVKVSPSEMRDAKTVGDLFALIQSKK